jgi:LacI family transcriptional regulator
MPVTIWDIVEATGLSQPAVSQILNGKGRFRPETRDRVVAAAKRLGWRPNASARAMAAGRFNAVALVLSDRVTTSMMPNGLIEHLDDAAIRQGNHLIIARLPDERLTDAEQAPKLLSHMMVDGMLVNYNADIPPGFRDIVVGTGLPAVWINSQQPEDSVYTDERAGAAEATGRLLAAGHRRIAFVDYNRGPGDILRHYSFAERRAGYREAMQAAGLAPRLIAADGGVYPPHRLPFTRAWMQAPDRPTAVLCYNHESIETIHVTATALGLELPRDLSLVTFADHRIMSVDLRVDHMLIDVAAVSATAVAMLGDRIGDRAHRPNRAIPMPYVGEGSVAPPAGG